MSLTSEQFLIYKMYIYLSVLVKGYVMILSISLFFFSLKKAGVDVYDVSSKIGQMFSKMIFDDGYVHCDPHPGNVLVQKDAAGNTQVRPKV